MTTYTPLSHKQIFQDFPLSDELKALEKDNKLGFAQQTFEISYKKPQSSNQLTADTLSDQNDSKSEIDSSRREKNLQLAKKPSLQERLDSITRQHSNSVQRRLELEKNQQELNDGKSWSKKFNQLTPKGTRKYLEISHREGQGYISDTQFSFMEKKVSGSQQQQKSCESLLDVRRSYIWDEDDKCYIDKHSGEKIYGEDLNAYNNLDDKKATSLVFDIEGGDHTKEARLEKENNTQNPRKMVPKFSVEDNLQENELNEFNEDSEDKNSTQSGATMKNLFSNFVEKKSKTMLTTQLSSNTLQIPGYQEETQSVPNNNQNTFTFNLKSEEKNEKIDEENLDKSQDRVKLQTMTQLEVDQQDQQLQDQNCFNNDDNVSHRTIKSYTSVGGTYYPTTKVYIHRPVEVVHYPTTYYSYLEPIQEIVTPLNTTETKITTIVHEPRRVVYDSCYERTRYVCGTSRERVRYISPARRIRYSSPSGNTYYRLN